MQPKPQGRKIVPKLWLEKQEGASALVFLTEVFVLHLVILVLAYILYLQNDKGTILGKISRGSVTEVFQSQKSLSTNK